LTSAGEEAKGVAPALRKALNDLNQRVRAHAAWSVARVAGEKQQALQLLRKVKGSSDSEAKDWAEFYLQRLAPQPSERKPKSGEEKKGGRGAGVKSGEP